MIVRRRNDGGSGGVGRSKALRRLFLSLLSLNFDVHVEVLG